MECPDCEGAGGAIDLKVYLMELRVEVAFVTKWVQYTSKVQFDNYTLIAILDFNIVILSSPRSRKWFSFPDAWNVSTCLPGHTTSR
jgi:hypothetical protein